MSSSPSRSEEKKKKKKIVFIHLDLGIGGAENLIINLALASLPPTPSTTANNNTKEEENSLNAEVLIYTTHCSQSHCFSEVKKPNGILSSSVRIHGSFLPATILNIGGHAICSSVRILYATYMACKHHPDADVFVLDVLPTSIPLITSNSWFRDVKGSVLFYCHFPDKLLTRDTVNGIPIDNNNANGGIVATARKFYRNVLDGIEEYTMSFADLILVNSKFTRGEVQRVFPSLQQSTSEGENEEEGDNLKVLYPPIDLTKFVLPNFDEKLSTSEPNPIVSLNRFERKKNVAILLQAYALLLSNIQQQDKVQIPPLIIAGGYDPRNIENVQHLSELKSLSTQLGISHKVQFAPNVNDTQRSSLLKNALCVVYTPHREHFGIVPLEAMYAGSPVIAVNSGGPKETVKDGQTGFLVENTSKGFMEAMKKLVLDRNLAVELGRNGHAYVRDTFGMEKFRSSWSRMVREAIKRGEERNERQKEDGGGNMGVRLIGYLMEIMMAFCMAWIFTKILRSLGVVGKDSSVVGEVRSFFSKKKMADEL